jgi:hypothetical protein
MKKLPLWIAASLGKKVTLTRPFVTAWDTYPMGWEHGVLVAVMADYYSGEIHAIVALDPNDPSYFENFAFDAIRPPEYTINFTLDIEEGFIEF